MLKKANTYYQNPMIMIKKQLLCLIILFLFAFEGLCQNYTDFQGRFIPSVSYRINDKWKIAGQYRYSLQKDFQEFRSSAAQFDIEYNITETISIETGYRFTTSFQEDNHRLFGGIKYDKKFNAFRLFSGIKYQFTTGSFDSRYMKYFERPNHTLREKIGLEYNIPNSKIDLYTSAELFLRLAEDEDPVKINRARYEIGVDYKFKYGNTFGFSFFYDDRTNPRKTDRFVLETKYSLSIDDMLKKIRKNKQKKTEE
ncbi:DUF2490 domain-containing protein [Flavobacterium saliperosum]|uniref:DUF2490 domain-containing protein n=2 Tax=Flavobacterium saliperosum TaxID=329186 RepID=A0A1G4VKE9_9FLAO|nr:DUF2490 domain-containing protein [Flavobacterium saliperosum]SCX07352.1 Protein of unknown function [Flavobacterium saliperosum]